jgi:hypothetical protein
MALPTLVNFPTSHAYREGGPRLVWDTCSQWLVEPNANERERVMGFPITTPLLEKCEDDTHSPEAGTWESFGTPETSEFDCRGQNTSP